MNISQTSVQVGGKDITIETGRYAEQASAAVTVQVGDTVVFASVVMGRENPNLGYFPLSVEYQEKLYAGGRIKGSRWVKRAGRPTDEAILKARLIDRTIRPLFPKGFKREVQVVVMVLSADGVNDADMVSMYAVSAALSLSNIPWEGPVAAVRIGLKPDSGEFIVNPTFEERETSLLDLVVSGSTEAVVMVEAGANEVAEAKMLEAFKLAEEENKRIATAIGAFAKEHGSEKLAFEPKEISADVSAAVKAEIDAATIKNMVKAKAALQDSGMADFVTVISEKNPDLSKADIGEVIDDLMKQEARRQTLEDGIRPDGRKLDEIRPLSSDVGLLPRTHGSAMFKRGSTQALTIVTLAAPALNQWIENMEGEYQKRYIHHYSKPPYTVGETGRVGWPSRREIGHGALAERALEPMIPAETDFPYTIQVTSELMSSNGSTSMASVCGSTLSLMDAGVPLKKPVAGIAMGLITDGKKQVVLSDIQGLEDHTGDMDFKVAGTADGITAMQMDIKVKGISFEVLTQALEQARKGRLHILEHMLSTLAAPRTSLSAFAPKIVTVTVPVTQIGEVIGPGGKMIKSIIESSGAEVDIRDDGQVFISALEEAAINKAKAMVEGIVKQVEPGEEYDGEVVRLTDFGAFVQILPGKDGLVHVSQMSSDFVKNPSEIVSEGDMVHVRVREIDDLGRISLTMLTPEQEEAVKQRRAAQPPRHGGGDRGRGGDSRFRSREPRRDFNRNR